ncbi:flavonoid 3'-monooxygenase CYP75B137-like [Henckelia pumila]|uniref:flavonoid 3'-monooxygenase CYP75B137-like n=1 Tax=Henckelia pumila TaxID=405737 RepID=UPI003C6E1445
MSTSEAGLMLGTTVAVLAVILLITFLIRSRRKNSPPRPPGPRGYPGLVGSLLSLNPELTTCFTQLANTYGPIFTLKLGRKVGIVISSPELAQEILKRHDATFAYRDMPVVATETSYGGLNISWSPYGPEWRMRRKLAGHEILSKNGLDSVNALRRREVRLMVKHIYIHSQAGSPVNVGERIFLTILDILTSMLWGGRHLGGDERDARRGVELREVIIKMIELFSKLNISDFYPQLARFDIQGMHKRMKVLMRRFDTLFDDMIEQRLKMQDGGGDNIAGEAAGSCKDFLHVLLKLKEEQNGNEANFTLKHVKALLMDIISGGTESTGNTVEFALAEMMNQPHILRKVQEELETVADKHTVLEETAIQNLPYLRALMKETLRLHPAIPLLLPHRSNSACNVAGYQIPKGSLVFINAWAIHRDPSTWDNPLEFRPERFLDQYGKLGFCGNDLRYFPFGSGRRICAGTAMAERMFTYLVATLVHSFDWKLAPGEKMDLSEQYGLISRKKIPLLAIPTPRLSGLRLYE